jgi:hypothetical protein
LTILQKITTWAIAGDLLKELGYAWPVFDRLPRPPLSRRFRPMGGPMPEALRHAD